MRITPFYIGVNSNTAGRICIVFKVGFMALQLVDEGTTAVVRSGRFHKDYEGQSDIYALGRFVASLAGEQGITLGLSIKGSSEFLDMPIGTDLFKNLFNVVSDEIYWNFWNVRGIMNTLGLLQSK